MYGVTQWPMPSFIVLLPRRAKDDDVFTTLAGVGAVATIWATKLISNAAAAAIDNDDQQAAK